ncbi:ATP-binding protein [Blastococcus sp. CT_GayMR16]|uniref:sensor histidine kinase n=1 Tax=Blastococcus sp. CT_GayMR16 TaxID=2559607 RepID=UPI0010747C30|nr:ATP-binding protein [Blastococcus sp. CT_GayMR16]TFV86629.1 HAMP domain-containing protein [Blastococcus sp. CT_GayMR16]
MSRARRPATLRARVAALAALAVLGVLTVAGTSLVLAQRAMLTESLDESLAQQSDAVARALRAGRSPTLDDLRSDDAIVEVRGPGGAVVTSLPAAAPRLPAGASGVRTVDLATGPARLLARPVGADTVVVAASLDDVEESVAALVRGLAVGVPLSAAVLAGIVWWAVGRALAPVEDIRTRVDAISASRLDRRVPEPTTAEEMARLARTMNAMLARLQHAADRQRAFVADASHELRSPLARMRAEMEVDLAHPETADPAATAASVLAETVTLQRLVDDLLLLARGDAGALEPGRREPVDLDEVVQARVAAFRSTGEHRIDVSGVQPVQVAGDPSQLQRVIANLLDNAVRHARNRIVVTLDEGADGAELTVADDGPGVPPPDQGRIFERFTRLDDARSARDGGAGLGLAIARGIAERHGGTLTVDGPPGARFLLRLPSGRP